ncbi:hypothetical protein [Butyrivibrio sp. AE3009]|uniref:hypothetical protein n=1 Tax=Butyrivibrio sp. AE3009 TaxID=1280666 RepID=UPI0003B692D4|nr:hypothetical protein [Butyrivibrio sp. AE3009]
MKAYMDAPEDKESVEFEVSEKDEVVVFEVKDAEDGSHVSGFDTHRALKERFILDEENDSVKKEYIGEDLDPDIREELAEEEEAEKIASIRSGDFYDGVRKKSVVRYIMYTLIAVCMSFIFLAGIYSILDLTGKADSTHKYTEVSKVLAPYEVSYHILKSDGTSPKLSAEGGVIYNSEGKSVRVCGEDDTGVLFMPYSWDNYMAVLNDGVLSIYGPELDSYVVAEGVVDAYEANCDIFYLKKDGSLYLYDPMFGKVYLADENITQLYCNRDFRNTNYIYAKKVEGSKTKLVRLDTLYKEYATIAKGNVYPQFVSAGNDRIFFSTKENGGMLYVYGRYSESKQRACGFLDASIIVSSKKGDVILIRDNSTGDVYLWKDSNYYHGYEDMRLVCKGGSDVKVIFATDSSVAISYVNDAGKHRVTISQYEYDDRLVEG